jgi:hypothetical protein
MIASRKAQNLSTRRTQKLKRFIVIGHFSKLKTTLEEPGLMDKPLRIYNVDDKGCRSYLYKYPLLLTPPHPPKKSGKHSNLVAAEHGENVTILSIENAVGSAIRSVILFKGQRMVGEWLDALPPGSIAQMTSSGSMTIEAFVS